MATAPSKPRARIKQPRAASVTVPCRCCGGTGRIELTGVYARTLALLRGHRGEINGAALAKLAGAPATAMNNRLVALERHGLATGRRDGRQRLWTATKQEPTS